MSAVNCMQEKKQFAALLTLRIPAAFGTAFARKDSINMSGKKMKNTGRVRILKVLNHFFIGGTERQFLYVANGLDRSRFAVDVACLRREGPLLENLSTDMTVHTYPVAGSFYTGRSVLSQFKLLKDIRSRRFDIVHTYGWYSNVFAIPASRLAFGPATIASVRDIGAYLTPAKIKALKIVCGLADCVLANSNAGRDWLVAQGVKKQKIEVIPNGIIVPLRAERMIQGGPLRQEFGIPSGTPVCACVGRVVKGKGIDDFLRAARILEERGRDVRFLVIGARSVQREYQSEVERLARSLNIEHRLVFTGQRQDVAPLLR